MKIVDIYTWFWGNVIMKVKIVICYNPSLKDRLTWRKELLMINDFMLNLFSIVSHFVIGTVCGLCALLKVKWSCYLRLERCFTDTYTISLYLYISKINRWTKTILLIREVVDYLSVSLWSSNFTMVYYLLLITSHLIIISDGWG